MAAEMSLSPTASFELTIVESPACHYCDAAKEVAAELSATYPMTVRVVGSRTPEGIALVQEHRAAMAPLVLLDGRFFCAGRLSRPKLRARLDRLIREGASPAAASTGA